MSAPQNFRSAFNGFNREDVVRYLEYLNSRHHTQVNQLTEEAEYLRQELDRVRSSVPSSRELEQLREHCALLQAQLEESQDCRRALEARCAGMDRELEEAKQMQTVVHCHVEQELEAYRRAERLERVAQERADVISHRTNSILAEATSQVDAVAREIGALSDNVLGQLEQLRQGVAGSKAALKSAAEALSTLQIPE